MTIEKTIKVAAIQSTEKQDQPCRSGSSEEERASAGGNTDSVACLVSLHVEMMEASKRADFKAEVSPQTRGNSEPAKVLTGVTL